MPYEVAPAGPDKVLLDLLDKARTHWAVVAGLTGARAVYGIYKSLRQSRAATKGTVLDFPVAPIIYLLSAGVWYVITDF